MQVKIKINIKISKMDITMVLAMIKWYDVLHAGQCVGCSSAHALQKRAWQHPSHSDQGRGAVPIGCDLLLTVSCVSCLPQQ